VGAKHAVDVFCGGHTSFYKTNKNQLFAFGLNNHGQLGIGTKENTFNPTLVHFEDADVTVMQVEGGEHHTVCVTNKGKVYCWGRNDESQCGAGDLFEPYKRQEALKAHEKMMAEQSQQPAAKLQEAEDTKGDSGEAKEKPAKKTSRKVKQSSQKDDEPDLDGIGYFLRPHLVQGELVDKVVTSVAAGSNYCYALVRSSNELYSWGMGYNYVLGTREEDNVHEPVKVHPMQFHNNQVKVIGAGNQHVVVLTTAATDPTAELPAFEGFKKRVEEEAKEKKLVVVE